ncbi:hypothetical protein BU15DRAFT_50737 [Melanogaster broomeanus]|nr:hypothetical protein BU15DRAFT_50737 [Melanogaster broomeanus]
MARDPTAESQEVVPEKTCCHQCRNTTLRPKMQCSNASRDRVCGKRFCNRCILNRYPDITFDQFSAGFMCPVCTNTCNCSTCSRRRGEEFISMRGGGFAGSRLQTNVTLVRDELDPKRVEPEPSSSAVAAPPPKPMFWAHVYGMEGERVGRAFISSASAAMGDSQAGQPKQKPKQKPKKKQKLEEPGLPRVFVGRPQKSWKIRALRDLEPSADCGAWSRNGNGKGKKANDAGNGNGDCNGAATDRRPLRVFIGSPAALHEPYSRMRRTPDSTPTSSRCSSPGPDSDGCLTPLSELEDAVDYWPQPDIGECCAWGPPPPLFPPLVGPATDADADSWSSGGPLGPGAAASVQRSVSMMSDEEVARAISAALAAIA